MRISLWARMRSAGGLQSGAGARSSVRDRLPGPRQRVRGIAALRRSACRPQRCNPPRRPGDQRKRRACRCHIGRSRISTAIREATADWFPGPVRTDSQRSRIYSARGSVLARLGRNEEALADFDAALRLDTSYASALNHRAAVLIELGRMDRAARGSRPSHPPRPEACLGLSEPRGGP